MAKKSAKDSLSRLRTGIARKTPASRASEEAGVAAAEERVSDREGAVRSEVHGRTVERKVRVSVDLPRSEHKYLRDFAYDAEADAMSVMRTLLEEMREDKALASRVQGRLVKRTERNW